MPSARAVKIRAARHREAEVLGQGAIARFGSGIMIGVPGLQRIEAGGGQRRDTIVALCNTRVRERGNAAGVMDDGDDLFGTGAAPRHERGAAELEKAVEGLVARRHVAGGQQRRGQVRPADALATRALREDRRDVIRHTERGQPFSHFVDAPQPVLPLAVEKRAQARAARVDEVAEHVDVTPIVNRADLDARDQLESGVARRVAAASLPAVVS